MYIVHKKYSEKASVLRVGILLNYASITQKPP